VSNHKKGTGGGGGGKKERLLLGWVVVLEAWRGTVKNQNKWGDITGKPLQGNVGAGLAKTEYNQGK